RIDGSGQLLRQDRECLARAVLFLEAGQLWLARRRVAEASSRRCGEADFPHLSLKLESFWCLAGIRLQSPHY
ncbi:MAG TPA: hypothetical protein VE735_02840, partial [Gammaproteobacteria bacterium]|nr:hypothetical protein [Gammaproteobacteria bacterium]